MIPSLRRAFNAAWTPAKHAEFERSLRERVGSPSSSPFLKRPASSPRPPRRARGAGTELTRQALRGEARRPPSASCPIGFAGRTRATCPRFVQVDFGLVRDADGASSRASSNCRRFRRCTAFSRRSPTRYRATYDLPASLDAHLDGLTREEYLHARRRRPSSATHEPRRRRADGDSAGAAEDAARLRDDRAVLGRARGRYRRRGPRRPPAVLSPRRAARRRSAASTTASSPTSSRRKQLALPFDYRDDLDVEWAGHPAWYFRISKFSIPWLRHPSVPRTWFLDEVDRAARANASAAAEAAVLVCGRRHRVRADRRADLRAIPREQRDQYILQERIAFEPVIETPHGADAGRDPDDVRLDRPAAPGPAAVRMGRGKMMGVDHNKGLRWVGGVGRLDDVRRS